MGDQRELRRRLRARPSTTFHLLKSGAGRRAFRFVAFALVMCAGVFTAWAIVVSIPSVDNIQNRVVGQSTKIYDRTGNVLLYDVHGTMRRTEVPLDQISPNLRNATVAIEDATFYSHHGFRPLSFLRAILANVVSRGYAQGGSTITQQVVKNTLLTQDKTIIRKLKEIVLAMKLEKVATKDQILNIYLNETGYGGTIYGVEEASQYFFGKDAKDLDLAESAYMAALPQAPTRYSPHGNHRSELEARKNLVLSRMKDLNYISTDDYNSAAGEQVTFQPQSEGGIKAPHFVFYIREYLEQKYGADVVANEGLHVVTTLDYDLQQKAEATVTKFGPNMLKNFNASNEGIVAVDPKTGQVLAMVGSRDYFNNDIDGQVNVTLSHRQPGSSFKPFVYATAFEKGYTPDTVVFDVQTQFSTACSPQDVTNDTPPCYSPSNYDNAFHGPMKLRDAIAQSMNIPSVKTLYLAGIQDSIQTAVDLGITTLADAGHYGLTLVLGGGEVTLLEMTGAYSVFANDGVKNPPTGILRVEDGHGNTLEEYKQNATQVLDPQIARQVNSILSDNVARTPEFGADSPLYFHGYNVADKTGTTNDFRDVWVLGYTPGMAVGAWAGNNDNSPMQKKIAAFIIAPMWHEFFAYALSKYPSDDFVPSSPDPDYASLPPVLKGEWNTNPALGIHDILFWIDKNNPRSGTGNSQTDSQFSYWDYAVSLWAQQQVASSTSMFSGSIPGAGGGAPTSAGFAIAAPPQGSVIPHGQSFQALVSANATLGIKSVAYYLNNTFVGISNQPPYVVAIQPSLTGAVLFKAIADTNMGQLQASTMVVIQ